MTEDWLPFLQAFFAAGGIGLIGMIGRGVWKHVTGRAGRELTKNRSYLDRMHGAEEERDWSDAYRRVIAEHASEVRGIVERAGLGEQLPPWPSPPTRPDRKK